MTKMTPFTTKLLSFLAMIFKETKSCAIILDPTQVTYEFPHYKYPTIDFTMGTIQNYPLTISTNHSNNCPLTLVMLTDKPLWADLVDFNLGSGSDYQLELNYA